MMCLALTAKHAAAATDV